MTSIIVPHRDTPALLRDCLASLAQHTAQAHQVIVVDDGSLVMPHFAWLDYGATLLPMNPAGGYTSAVNRGLEYALRNGDSHVVLTNTDVEFADDWLKHMEDSLLLDDRIGIAGARVTDFHDRSWIQQAGATGPGQHRSGWSDRGELQEVRINGDDYLPFCCVLLRREMVQDIGLLDGAFRVYGSDNDYCYRAKEAGWKLCYQPQAIVYHHGGRTCQAMMSDPVFREWVVADQKLLADRWPAGAREALHA